LVFRDGSIPPFFDGRVAVFVCFVADDGVVGKEGVEIVGLSGRTYFHLTNFMNSELPKVIAAFFQAHNTAG
jgi:hypothetical protein